ncbi:MAG TPA: flagellar motor protein MotD [Steroidobacteraceae bacterium]
MKRVRHTSGRRRRKPEEHANHEAWAIPYADLLTLLLAFFVVMYAISSVNAGKYRVLSDSLFAAFRGEPRAPHPIEVGEKQVGADSQPGTPTAQPSQPQSDTQSVPVPAAVRTSFVPGAADSPIGVKLPSQAAVAATALAHVADQVEKAMDQLVKKDLVTIRRNDFWIEVEMRTDILFPSGSARLAGSAMDVLERLGSVLAPFPNPIRVEGHTDNVPIRTTVFSSNWELSAARAASVVRVLANHGVAPTRLAVVGYGEQRPLKANLTAEGRNANRRVVVVILSTELMRQSDPAMLPAAGGSSGNLAPGAASLNTPSSGAAVAFPGESAQAVAAPEPPARQANTGTEPAP